MKYLSSSGGGQPRHTFRIFDRSLKFNSKAERKTKTWFRQQVKIEVYARQLNGVVCVVVLRENDVCSFVHIHASVLLRQGNVKPKVTAESARCEKTLRVSPQNLSGRPMVKSCRASRATRKKVYTRDETV